METSDSENARHLAYALSAIEEWLEAYAEHPNAAIMLRNYTRGECKHDFIRDHDGLCALCGSEINESEPSERSQEDESTKHLAKSIREVIDEEILAELHKRDQSLDLDLPPVNIEIYEGSIGQ